MKSRGLLLSFGLALLLCGTLVVFVLLDRSSHSASDTLRPFLLTMTPVWLVALAGARALLRQSR
jgi:hypothetical protein